MQRTHGEWWRTHHETPTKHTANGWRSPTKLVANIPQGVGADSSCPYPNIIKNAYSFHRIRVSISTYTHFHIIKYVYSFHRMHISVRHFVGVYVYAGTINRLLRLQTNCQNVANGLPKHCKRIAKTLQTDCQNIADGLPIIQRTPTNFATNTLRNVLFLPRIHKKTPKTFG